MNLVVFILTWVGAWVGGGGARSTTCPSLCRCEGAGMLQSVACVDAGLRSVPSGLSRFTSSLNLQNNHLRRVPPAALKNLKNLRSLHLDANLISRLPASSFRGLSSLRHLWLDDNVLTEVPVLALSSLTELQALTLALNHISSVPDRAFAALVQLLVLYLHGNRIHSLGRRSFDGLKRLETLDLSFNRINRFPTAVRSLSSLRHLNLQNNSISVVPENAFVGNPSIETINLQNNPLHAVGHSSLRLLPDPRTLVSPEGRKLPGHPQLRVPRQRQHALRSTDLQDAVDSSGRDTRLSTCCLDSLRVIFIVSIVFNLLVLLCTLLLLLPPSLRPPPALFWFRLLAGLSGSSVVSSGWFWGPDLDADPGSGVFLFSLSSEVCVLVLMGAAMGGKTRTQSCSRISCVVGCSLALTLAVLPLVAGEDSGLCPLARWTHGSALVLFNAFCFLLVVLTHMARRPRLRGVREDTQTASLAILLCNALLCSSASLLGPDVSTCAALVLWSLPCCLDPLLYMILSPRSTVLRPTKSKRIGV